MAFATADDVAAYFPQTPAFTTTTNITLAQVDQWLEEDSAIIRSKLSVVVDFNNTTTDGDEILKQINAKMTACKIDGALPHVNAVAQSEEKMKRDLCKEAKMMIEAIIDGELVVSEPCRDVVADLLASNKPYPPNKYDKDYRY